MLYEKDEATSAFQAVKESSKAYLQHVGGLIDWLEGGRDRWKLLGPYWGVVQAILEKHPVQRSLDYQAWNDGSPPPDFLSLYNYGEAHLNLCAAMMYINRTSAATDMNVDAPHSIITPDGEALYIPGVGIIEH
jgi:hypothetical protein